MTTKLNNVPVKEADSGWGYVGANGRESDNTDERKLLLVVGLVLEHCMLKIQLWGPRR